MNRDQLRSYIENLEPFVETPGAFEHLRQTFVELALAGKLTTPSAAQNSGFDLLKSILEQRQALELKGTMGPVDAGHPMFADLPSRWTLAYLGDLLSHCRNGCSASPNTNGDGYPLLRISAGTSRKDGYVDLNDIKYAVLGSEQAEPFMIQPGDLLACRFSGSLGLVGRVAQVPDEVPRPTLHPDKLILMRAISVRHDYLRVAMGSSAVRRQIEAVAATTAGNIGINGRQVKALVVPLPPLEEQEQIAGKVRSAVSLVNRLQVERTNAQTSLSQAFVDLVTA
ncbi:hypothetical protein ACFYP7_31420 [Micromonospora arida]|uniref:restriction endonuclease subunit S n=1 Tax=Micromonospora arida TaxID=2203715 RepID=UPI0036A0EFBA